jgi:hypothetical protein
VATAPEKNYQVRWLRPEYQDREAELVSRSEIAKIGQVTPRSVTSWAKAEDFPEPVKEVKASRAPARYWVAAEVFAWMRRRGAAGAEERLQAMLTEYEIEQRRYRRELDRIDTIVEQLRAAIEQSDTI